MSGGSNAAKLVRMANQIAANFDYGSNRAEAAGNVLDHMSRFWTPDMKQTIVALEQQGDSGLNEVARAAVAELAKKYGAPA